MECLQKLDFFFLQNFAMKFAFGETSFSGLLGLFGPFWPFLAFLAFLDFSFISLLNDKYKMYKTQFADGVLSHVCHVEVKAREKDQKWSLKSFSRLATFRMIQQEIALRILKEELEVGQVATLDQVESPLAINFW